MEIFGKFLHDLFEDGILVERYDSKNIFFNVSVEQIVFPSVGHGYI